MMQKSGDVDHAGIRYIRRGWSVIPIEPRGTECLCDWQPFIQRLADEEEIDDWSWHFPHANIGIVTGALSRLVVVEVDRRRAGRESLALVERMHGGLPDTVEAAMGGDGRQLYFAHPGSVVACVGALLPGLRISGDGGYVVAPPSVDATGGYHEWLAGHGPDEIPIAPLPTWVVALANREWGDLARDGARGSQRGAAVAAITRHLLDHGIDAALASELALAWNDVRCEPPLDAGEARAAVDESVRPQPPMQSHATPDMA